MLFNSYEFLFVFLPVVLFVYYRLGSLRRRAHLLTVASYFFYGWWDARFCLLMLTSTLIDYYAGRKVYESEEGWARKRFVVLSVAANLSLLGYFKYSGFLAQTANELQSLLDLPVLAMAVPVGISFYTFQSISYTVDIYRRQAKPADSFIDFACYISLFPQLVAGPIVRYAFIEEQLRSRRHELAGFATGVSFFLAGLAKKALIADGAAVVADPVFAAADPDMISAWIGVLAYSVQIYFDFSGYSDMAVGLGMMFGFKFPQNFNSPYQAVSFSDFWRRWHMSLSGWLRDYLYIPLGGSRGGKLLTYRNLILTMLLGGLWHGAAWTFVIWGAWHGGLLALERFLGDRNPLLRLPIWARRPVIFVFVLVGWVFFRCETVEGATVLLTSMFGLAGAESIAAPLPLVALTIGAVLFSWFARNTWQVDMQLTPRRAVGLGLGFLASLVVLLGGENSPFLYYQF